VSAGQRSAVRLFCISASLVVLSLSWGCASLGTLRSAAPDPESRLVLDAEEIEAYLSRAAREMRTGAFAESAGHFEQVLAQRTLSQARRVLALAGAFTAWHLAGEREPERAAARRFFRPDGMTVSARGDLLPRAAASELRGLRHVALRVVAAADAERKRAVAASSRNPIPLLAPSEAGETLGWIRCGRRLGGRYLIESDEERSVAAVPFILLRARCSEGGARRSFWFDLSLWYAFTATHLDGANPPIGFTRADAARVVTEEFGRAEL
jgi:hypothetical protein